MKTANDLFRVYELVLLLTLSLPLSLLKSFEIEGLFKVYSVMFMLVV